MNTAQERIEWVLKFVQTDLDILRSGDWLNLQEDIAAFSGQVRISKQEWNPKTIRLARIIAEVLLLDCVKRSREQGGGLTLRLPSTKKKPTLDAVLDGVTFDDSNSQLKIDARQIESFSFDLSQAGPVRLTVAARTLPAAFAFALGSTLSGIDTARIRDCPTCCGLFFATHGRQKFCTPSCEEKVSLRRFRDRHREEINRKARQRYTEKAEAKSGGRVQHRKPLPGS